MLTAFVLFFTLGSVLTGCERSPTSPRRVVTLFVQPAPPPDLRVGETLQLSVTVTTRQRNRNVTYDSDRPSVATVSPAGLITAVGPGLTTITVTSVANPTTGKAAVAIRVTEQTGQPASIVKLGQDPPPATVGTTLASPLSVYVVDDKGQPVGGATVNWHISAGGGSVTPASTQTNAGGLAFTSWRLGSIPGVNTVTASVAGLGGQTVTFTTRADPIPVATVAISPTTAQVGVTQTRQLTATARDAQGNELTGRIITWSSSNTAVATVDPATGLVRGVAPGTATITATSEGRSGTATVTVTLLP